MIPDWLLEEVKAERLVLGLASILRPELEGAASDAEVCVYLYTASLRAPMAPEYVQVYLHLVAKLMKRRGVEVPLDIEVGEQDLRPDELAALAELRQEIWRARGGHIHHPLLEAVRSLKVDAERHKNGYQACLEV